MSVMTWLFGKHNHKYFGSMFCHVQSRDRDADSRRCLNMTNISMSGHEFHDLSINL